MADVLLCESAKQTLKTLDPSNQKEVARVISFLEHDELREGTKVDLNLVENDFPVCALVFGRMWLAFVEERDGAITIVHISVRSRFRPF